MGQYDIYLIGTGATGSNLIGNLAQYAISEKDLNSIILIDGDDVETKNFKNQKFTKKDVGLNKATVLARRYSKLGINISFKDSFVTDADMLVNMIKSNSILNGKTPMLISCVDNHNARIIFNDVFNSSLLDNLIYIDTGNGDESKRIGQMIVGCKAKGEILAPPVCEYFPEILDGDIEVETKVNYSCSQQIVEKPQALTSNVLSATAVFLEVVNIISYKNPCGKYFSFDAENIAISKRL